MPFNSSIDRTGAAALIPEEVSNELLTSIEETSAVLQLARKLANMSRNQERMPVLDALASAYFVAGDTGLKQTTKLEWANKYVYAEEIAAIVPIPENVLSDAAFDIWGSVKPALTTAFGKVIDGAALYGTNIPTTWTSAMGGAGLIAVITAASQLCSLADYTDLYEALLGEADDGTDGLYMMVEADGFGVTGNVAPLSFKGKLRNMRDSNGVPIFPANSDVRELNGAPVTYPMNGAISSTYFDIAGQWDQLVYSIRQDMTYKILTEAVIQDQSGAIVYNLAQQDMVALRAVMRLGVALPNPINAINETDATRCAFSALTA